MLCVVLPAALAGRDGCPVLQMGRLRSRKAENLLDVASKSGTSDSRDVAYKHYAMTEPGWGGFALAQSGGPAIPGHCVWNEGT